MKWGKMYENEMKNCIYLYYLLSCVNLISANLQTSKRMGNCGRGGPVQPEAFPGHSIGFRIFCNDD